MDFIFTIVSRNYSAQAAVLMRSLAQAEQVAAGLREAMSQEPVIDPLELFDHVYTVGFGGNFIHTVGRRSDQNCLIALYKGPDDQAYGLIRAS